MSDENTDATSEPEVTPEATPIEEPQPTEVNLVEEAEAAATKEVAESGKKVSSLDELDLEGEVRKQVESYVSKAINDAIVTQQSRQQERLEEEGYMNRTQVEDMLVTKEAEYARRDQAKEQLLATLNAEGIDLGSEEHTHVQTYYRKAVEDGVITPNILLSEAGVRTLVAMSGVKGGGEGAGPQSGLPQTSPDGTNQYAGGTTQLNVEGKEGSTLADRVRMDMEKQLRNLA